VLACLAIGARATYVQPASQATGNNAYGYIDIGGTPGGSGAGVKQGGLSVDAFSAKDNALFNDQVFFNAPIHGLSTDPKTVNFGDGSHVVALSINNNMQGQTLQSDTTKNKNNTAGSGLDYLCSSTDGTLILCGESSGGGYDLCSNIDGDQTTVPTGYTRNPDGTCSPMESGPDICPNIPGTQNTAPSGYFKPTNGVTWNGYKEPCEPVVTGVAAYSGSTYNVASVYLAQPLVPAQSTIATVGTYDGSGNACTVTIPAGATSGVNTSCTKIGSTPPKSCIYYYGTDYTGGSGYWVPEQYQQCH
jgi:hypothetical protein